MSVNKRTQEAAIGGGIGKKAPPPPAKISKAAPPMPPGGGDADADDDEEDEGGDDEGDADDEEEASEKAQVHLNDLEKAINAFEDTTDTLGGTQGREQYLMARREAGTLSKAERTELGQILIGAPQEAGDGERPAPLKKSLRERLEEDGNMKDMLDASDALGNLAAEISDSLDTLAKAINNEGARSRAFQKSEGQMLVTLGRVAVSQGEMLEKSFRMINRLAKKIEEVEATPVPARGVLAKAQTVVRVLGGGSAGGEAKGGAAVEGEEQPLAKAQVFTGLRKLMEKATARDDRSAVQALGTATAKFESSGVIAKGLMDAVRSELAE